ncbi:MAG: nicotinate-nucleotide adenylyltransferase [Desulfobacteraceae bacterium]|nr:nicotinate-nucleotide adenylyltransferase [Desulfobacteraceae bacterium]
MRLGILGGTFNPVHLGHLRAAQEALELLNLDRMLFIPSALPPHKTDKSIAAFEHRWRMLTLATGDNPAFRPSDLERHMAGKSFTVNSLRKLHEDFPGSDLFFLVGLDAFLEMATWFRFIDLFRLASIVVLNRLGYGTEDVLAFLVRHLAENFVQSGEAVFTHPDFRPVYYLPSTRLDISSTHIRKLVAEGRSARYLVPEPVLSYIHANCLYGVNGINGE